MPYLHTILRQFFNVVRRENLHRIAFVILLVLFAGSTAFVYFEKNVNFSEALWWSIVTMTTVGYGDISPVTIGGRLVGIGVMLIGIGFLSVLTATIASVFIEHRLLENKGMKSADVSGHFLICGWNFRGKEIVSELRADPKCSNSPIVVVADMDEKPVDSPDINFVRGDINPETLKKANLGNAQAVIILSDDNLDVYSRDAKTILSTMTIKNECPDIYTCVELIDSDNLYHCQVAKADEIIVLGELSTNLLVQAALDHGVTRMISELVSNRYGMELYKIDLPSYLIGKTFFEVMCGLKKDHDILCLGIEDKSGKNLTTNPENEYRLKEEDHLITISLKRPEL